MPRKSNFNKFSKRGILMFTTLIDLELKFISSTSEKIILLSTVFSLFCLPSNFLLVRGDILDDYVKTEGAWLLGKQDQFSLYRIRNTEECAQKCDAETTFTCR